MSTKRHTGLRCKTEIRKTFTDAEFRTTSLELNRKLREIEQKQDEAKAASAVAKSAIKILQAECGSLRTQLEEGGANITVDAVCEFDREKGIKTFYLHAPGKPGHGEKLKDEEMCQQDFENLPLEPAESEP